MGTKRPSIPGIFWIANDNDNDESLVSLLIEACFLSIYKQIIS